MLEIRKKSLLCGYSEMRKQWTTLTFLGIGQRQFSDLSPYLSDFVSINNYFASFCCSNGKNCEELICSIKWFKFRLASVDEVHKSLFEIKSNASGLDDVSLAMLKYCM